MTDCRSDPTDEGKESYKKWRASLARIPEYEAIYEEEAARSERSLEIAAAEDAVGPSERETARRSGAS